MSIKTQAIVCASVLSGLAFAVTFDRPELAPTQAVMPSRESLEALYASPIEIRARAEQAIPEIIITADDVEAAFEWVCSDPRELVQGSGTVRVCEWVKR